MRRCRGRHRKGTKKKITSRPLRPPVTHVSRGTFIRLNPNRIPRPTIDLYRLLRSRSAPFRTRDASRHGLEAEVERTHGHAPHLKKHRSSNDREPHRLGPGGGYCQPGESEPLRRGLGVLVSTPSPGVRSDPVRAADRPRHAQGSMAPELPDMSEEFRDSTRREHDRGRGGLLGHDHVADLQPP